MFVVVMGLALLAFLLPLTLLTTQRRGFGKRARGRFERRSEPRGASPRSLPSRGALPTRCAGPRSSAGPSRPLGKRAHRRAVFTRMVVMFMLPTLIITPEHVCGMYQEAQAYRTLVAGVTANVPVGTTTTYTYDNNGNTTSRTRDYEALPTSVDQYFYDALNRLTAVDMTDPKQATGFTTYTYDADGLRNGKTDATGAATWCITDKNRPYGQVLYERITPATEPGGPPPIITAVTYVYGDDLVRMQRTSIDTSPEPPAQPTVTIDATCYYHYDGQMSTRQLTDLPDPGTPGDTVDVTDTYTYSAYGLLLAETYTGSVATPNNYRYTGEQLDPSSGMYYLRARYYEQGVGRFLTPDPFGGLTAAPASLHKYVFTTADPVNNVDPSGLMTYGQLKIALVIVGALIGMLVGAIVGYAVGGPNGAWIGGGAGAILGAFVGAVWGVSLFLWAIRAWGTVTGFFEGLWVAGNRILNSPTGSVPIRKLEEAAASSTSNITLWTRITTSPSAQRVLSTATDQRLADAAGRASRELFRFDIPNKTLDLLVRRGLADRFALKEDFVHCGRAYCVRGMEYLFQPEAVGYITQFMTHVGGGG